MAGITDKAYRITLSELGADVVITELVSATALSRGSKRTKEIMSIDSKEKNPGVQIFGCDLDEMLSISKHAESIGAKFVDINMGCPVKKVIKSGAGAAMLKNPEANKDLFHHLSSNLNIPVSIKIRTGWHTDTVTANKMLETAHHEGIKWLCIHGRSREEGYKGNIHWNLIKELKNSNSLPIIGNGDLSTIQDTFSVLKNQYCDHVMIGRKILSDPYFFLRLKNLEAPDRNYHHFIHNFFQNVIQHTHPKVQCTQLRKIFIYLSFGWQNHSRFRTDMYQCEDSQEKILKLSLDFFERNSLEPSYTYQPFLRGGHG